MSDVAFPRFRAPDLDVMEQFLRTFGLHPSARTDDALFEEAYAEMAANIAAGRLGRPEEVGDACAYLCSAQAGFISGQSLHVDGGSYAGVF